MVLILSLIIRLDDTISCPKLVTQGLPCVCTVFEALASNPHLVGCNLDLLEPFQGQPYLPWLHAELQRYLSIAHAEGLATGALEFLALRNAPCMIAHCLFLTLTGDIPVCHNLFRVLDPDGTYQGGTRDAIKALDGRSDRLSALVLLNNKFTCPIAVFQALCSHGLDTSDLGPNYVLTDVDMDAELVYHLFEAFDIQIDFALKDVLALPTVDAIIDRIPFVRQGWPRVVQRSLVDKMAKKIKAGFIWTGSDDLATEWPLIACIVADFRHGNKSASISCQALVSWVQSYSHWDAPFLAMGTTTLHLLAQSTRRLVRLRLAF